MRPSHLDLLKIIKPHWNAGALIESLQLSEDRPQITAERLNTQNDFYGLATMLKRYAGIPPNQPVPFVLEHGIHNHPLNQFWINDLLPRQAHLFLCCHKLRAITYTGITGLRSTAIGPYIHYAIAEGDHSRYLRPNAHKRLLIIPNHSTHHVVTSYSIQNLIDTAKRDYPDYQEVVALLYWKDILLGSWKAYTEIGIPILCAGHIYDDLFMYRLLEILVSADSIISNYAGTPVFYGAYLGKPIQLCPSEASYVASVSGRPVQLPQHPLHEEMERRYLETFAARSESITDEQRALLSFAFQSEDVMSPAQLRQLFEGIPHSRNPATLRSIRIPQSQVCPQSMVSPIDLAEHFSRNVDPDVTDPLLNALSWIADDPFFSRTYHELLAKRDSSQSTSKPSKATAPESKTMNTIEELMDALDRQEYNSVYKVSRRLLLTTPNNNSIRIILAISALHLGLHKDCVTQCQEVLAKDPGHSLARKVLDKVKPAGTMPMPQTKTPTQKSLNQSIFSLGKNFYGNVLLSPTTLAQIAAAPESWQEIMPFHAKLAHDEYVQYLHGYYTEAAKRYGKNWHYLDIVNILYASSKTIKPTNYLEIGVRRGRSVCTVANGCPSVNIFAFDMWIQNYAGMENPGTEFVKTELQKHGHRGALEFINGNSHDTLPLFFKNHPGLELDMITVDGDHSERGALQDLLDVIPHLALGGVLVFDDIAHPSHPYLLGVWKQAMEMHSELSHYEYTESGYGVAFAIRIR